MNLQIIPFFRARQHFNRSAFRAFAVIAAMASIICVRAADTNATPLSVSQAYLLSDWSSPNSSTPAPFNLNGTAGFQLSLNSSGVATSATALGGPLTIQTTDRLYYQSHSGTIDPNEVVASQLGSRVNSEIAKLDDAGLINESSDAALNIDFRNGSSVTLRTATPAVAVNGLVIFEDAGLDPFSLRYCYNVNCTLSDILFDGFDNATTAKILSPSSGFEVDDYAPKIDQAFWFIFNHSVTGGYFKIGETLNFGGNTSELLEVDFIGLTPSSPAPAPVPEPATLLLVAAGLMCFPLLRKMQSA